MAAWFVIHTHIHDRQAFARDYSPAVAELTAQFGGRYILRGGGGAVLEGNGEDGGGAIVIEWPDRKSALAFWNSSEYAAVKALRAGIADVSVTLVDG